MSLEHNWTLLWAWIGNAIALAPVLGGAIRAAIDEYRQEARRLRRICTGMLNGLDTSGVAMEFYSDPGIGVELGIVICAPGLDESNLGPAARVALYEYIGLGGASEEEIATWKMERLRVTGTEGEKKK